VIVGGYQGSFVFHTVWKKCGIALGISAAYVEKCGIALGISAAYVEKCGIALGISAAYVEKCAEFYNNITYFVRGKTCGRTH
jgi:hypothetical protein